MQRKYNSTPAKILLALAVGAAAVPVTAGINRAYAQSNNTLGQIGADVAQINNAMAQMKTLPLSTVASGLTPLLQMLCDDPRMELRTTNACTTSGLPSDVIPKTMAAIGLAAEAATTDKTALAILNGTAAAVEIVATTSNIQALNTALPKTVTAGQATFFKNP